MIWNFLILSVLIILFLIFKTVLEIIQHRRQYKKEEEIRKLTIDLAPMIFEMQIKIKDGSLEKFPSMKNQFISFVKFYDSFNEREDKLLGLSIKRSIYSIVDMDKKIENEAECIKDELLEISNKRILELFVHQLCFVHHLMLINNPYKYKLCFIIFELKKNPLVRNLRDFDFSSFKVSNTRTKKLEIADFSTVTYNGFKSVY